VDVYLEMCMCGQAVSGYPFYSCTSCREEGGFDEVLVSAVQKLGASNIKLSHDRSRQTLLVLQWVEAHIISRQHKKVVRLSALCTGRL
jgi:hypothetical protein